jgi:hypothetical protein
VGNGKRNVLEVVDPRTLDPDIVFHWNSYYTIAVIRPFPARAPLSLSDAGSAGTAAT